MAAILYSMLAAFFGVSIFLFSATVMLATFGPQADGSNGYYYVALIFFAAWAASFAAYRMAVEESQSAPEPEQLQLDLGDWETL